METELKTAVALRYDAEDGNDAPQIVASGRGHVADEIMRQASAHHIPERRDAALAGALSSLDLGARIPPELFEAVAEVLAFVYKLNAKK